MWSLSAIVGRNPRLRREGLLDHDLTTAEIAAWGHILPFPAAPNGNSPLIRQLFAQAARK